MKDIVDKYSEFLEREGIYDMFDITDSLVNRIYFKYVYPNYKIKHLSISKERRRKVNARQLNYTRLSLLRVKRSRNGDSSSGIKEGYVYIITNPAFPGYFKIGSALDVKKRLAQYQTYCPKRDFEMPVYYFSNDRYAEEKEYHKQLKCVGEWYEGDVNSLIPLFKQKRI